MLSGGKIISWGNKSKYKVRERKKYNNVNRSATGIELINDNKKLNEKLMKDEREREEEILLPAGRGTK